MNPADSHVLSMQLQERTMSTKTLTTKATDNHGNSYDVTLTPQDNNDWVLRITGTPGSWYMTTLEDGGPKDFIWIDFGGNWLCTNFAAVMDEAIEALKDTGRVTAWESKQADTKLWNSLLTLAR
jgi:hypothetical protein